MEKQSCSQSAPSVSTRAFLSLAISGTNTKWVRRSSIYTCIRHSHVFLMCVYTHNSHYMHALYVRSLPCPCQHRVVAGSSRGSFCSPALCRGAGWLHVRCDTRLCSGGFKGGFSVSFCVLLLPSCCFVFSGLVVGIHYGEIGDIVRWKGII